MAAAASSLASLSLPLFSPPRRLRRTSFSLRQRPTIVISMSSYRSGGSSSTVPAADRLISGLCYGFPLFNSVKYGRFLFVRFPPLASAFDLVFPFISVYHSIPYASFVAFFALYLCVVRNPRLSRYVRFNSMQALVLDILLALPSIAQRILGAPSGAFTFRLFEIAYSAVFSFTFACFAYALVSCILGRTPYLPLVASAADRQL